MSGKPPSANAAKHGNATQRQASESTLSTTATKSAPSSTNTNPSAASATSTTTSHPKTLATQVYRVALFDHLPKKQTPKDMSSLDVDRILHPATIELGLLFSKGMILSDDDRAHALLVTFTKVVGDYTTPPRKLLREDLDRYISKQVQYLVDCRQLSKSMGNIIKYLRHCISKILPETKESDAKAQLLAKLNSFAEERIVFAGESIAQTLMTTINDHDVILTFGSSPLLRKALITAASCKTFRVIVIDTRPLHEGLLTLQSLSQVIHCTYSPLSGAAVAMKDVTKVILGASSLLSNGSMLAPAGTAMIAALAKQRQVPVIVACESYKFSDKVQLDAIVFNELGHVSELSPTATIADPQEDQPNLLPLFRGRDWHFYRGSAEKHPGTDPMTPTATATVPSDADVISFPTQWHRFGNGSTSTMTNTTGSKANYEMVNLRYDLTPIHNISVVATESGLIPPTSVPVMLREIQSDQSGP